MVGFLDSKKLREMREAAGMTTVELAERIGVTQPMICHMESGFKDPSVAVLARMAKVFGCSMDDFGNRDSA